MSNFALISDGLVVNIAVWDGTGDLFSDYQTVNLDEINAGIGWSYSDGQFSPPPAPEVSHDELVAQAEMNKQSLLISARSTISIWQTELQLGIISDDDKASLINWLSYIKELQAIDTSSAPDINWPSQPGT
ncbi:TPA: tail fiber assembly protein [Enterobacter hormaechei subsp. steigerwaltii]|nr:tail fiber assembly protein [Enterobacter hormaechei subsp. steigerwaltii]